MGSGYLVRRGVVGSSSEATVTFDIQNVKIFRKGLISLRFPVYSLAATTVGNYALFGGGIYSSSYFSTVNAYNINLVRSIPTELSVGRGYLAATTVGNYALFGGGQFSSVSNVVDAYDSNLVRSSMDNLLEERYYLAATTVGKYALFGGGTDAYVSDDVDIYTFDSTIQVYPGTKYKFNNMVEEETATEWKEITFDEPLNGYIKISNAEIN